MPTAHVWLELGKHAVTLLQCYLLLRQTRKESRVSHAHLILVHGQLQDQRLLSMPLYQKLTLQHHRRRGR